MKCIKKQRKFDPWMLKRIINKFHTLPHRRGGVKKVWKIPYFFFILFLKPSLNIQSPILSINSFQTEAVTDDEKPISFRLNIHSVTFVPLGARGCRPWHGCKVRELRARKRINKLINLPTRFCWRRDPKSKINVSCCAALMS